MEQKLEGLEVKHTILADQDKKTDAGKLRYDLIEWDMLDGIDFDSYDCGDLLSLGKHTEPLNEHNLKMWIITAVVALGGMNNFLYELARVYTFGAEKYGDFSWKTVPNAEARYLGAMQRHIRDFKLGNYVNYKDGMLYHSAQIAFNAISLLWLKQNKGE